MAAVLIASATTIGTKVSRYCFTAAMKRSDDWPGGWTAGLGAHKARTTFHSLKARLIDGEAALATPP